MNTFLTLSQPSATGPNLRPAAATLAIFAAIGLAACGSSSSSPDAPPAPPPPSATPPIASSSCQAFPDATVGAVSGTLPAATGSVGPVTYSVVTQPALGTLSLAGSSGSFSYTPTTASRGYRDTFTWKATNQQGQSSPAATATVIVGKRRIMPMGDSITAGVETYTDAAGDGPPEAQKVGYRKQLQTLLSNGGYATDFVGSLSSGTGAGIVDASHEGHTGQDTSFVNLNIEGWLSSSTPDVVLLHIGTNDHSSNTGFLNSALTKVSTWAANPARQPVGLLLAKIIDQRPNSPEVNAVVAYNNNLQAIYDTQWADAVNTNQRFRVRLTDMFSVVDPVTDLTPIAEDSVGLHPNTSGYNKMAQKWYDTLVAQGLIAKCP